MHNVCFEGEYVHRAQLLGNPKKPSCTSTFVFVPVRIQPPAIQVHTAIWSIFSEALATVIFAMFWNQCLYHYPNMSCFLCVVLFCVYMVSLAYFFGIRVFTDKPVYRTSTNVTLLTLCNMSLLLHVHIIQVLTWRGELVRTLRHTELLLKPNEWCWSISSVHEDRVNVLVTDNTEQDYVHTYKVMW